MRCKLGGVIKCESVGRVCLKWLCEVRGLDVYILAIKAFNAMLSGIKALDTFNPHTICTLKVLVLSLYC